MPYKISWFLKDRIILGKVWGKSEDSELTAYNEDVNVLLNESQADEVYMIFDGLQAEQMPSLTAFKAFTFPKHPRFKYTIALKSSNRLLNFIASATTQIFGTRMFFANSPDDVIQYLHDLMPDLPDLTPYRYLLEKDPTLSRKSNNVEKS